jgi:hypothetical protein
MTNTMLGYSTLESLTPNVNAPLVGENLNFGWCFYKKNWLDLGWENLRERSL